MTSAAWEAHGPSGEWMSEALTAIEKHWHSTCRVLFRQEIGPIKDFVPWLTELNEPILHRKSSLSGKPVSFPMRLDKISPDFDAFLVVPVK